MCAHWGGGLSVHRCEFGRALKSAAVLLRVCDFFVSKREGKVGLVVVIVVAG